MAIRRGDAVRLDERLVVTPAAVERAAMAADGVLIALSDPDYRSRIALLEAAPDDPRAARDAARLAARFGPWDERIFGERLGPDNVGLRLDDVLVGRRLDGLLLAAGPAIPLPAAPGSFADNIDQASLMVAFPSSLVRAGGGVGAFNDMLERNRAAPAAVRPPGPADVRARVHGGLLHPGETLDRPVPDNHSLRIRAATCCPALSLFTAMLLLGRRPDLPLRVAAAGGECTVRWRREPVGGLVAVLAAFAAAQGWCVVRPPRRGLSGDALRGVAEGLGIAATVGERVVLEERWFVRLQGDPEARLCYEAIQPLADRLHAWLDGLPGPVPDAA
jgi:hypothetical protein